MNGWGAGLSYDIGRPAAEGAPVTFASESTEVPFANLDALKGWSHEADRLGTSYAQYDYSSGRHRLFSIRPITSRIATRMLRTKLISGAERTVRIASGCSRSVEVPVMLPDEPARIRAHHAESSPTINFELLTGHKVEHGPTQMHLLRDVIIADGAVLGPWSYDRIAPGARRWFLHGHFDRPAESIFCSTYMTEKYFGHWLREGMSHELLADDLGLPALVHDGPVKLHEDGYRQLFSLFARRTNFAHCDRLWVLDDTAQNTHWLSRYTRLREIIRTRVKAPRKGTHCVFMARGDTAQGRNLTNRSEVRSALEQRGWIILEPEREDAETVARTLSKARLVVSPEGSALGHATIAVPPGAGILTIIGAQHFNVAYKGLCDALGVKFGLTVADAVNESDFHQPIDRLLHAIDLLDTAVEKN